MNIRTFCASSFFLSFLLVSCQEPVIEPLNPLVKQQFKIKLPTARVTTYDWYFKEIVKQLSPAGAIIPNEPGLVKMYGDPTYVVRPGGIRLKDETKIFTFQAHHAGTVVLLFEKKHRYKTGKKVRESKEIKVTIKEK